MCASALNGESCAAEDRGLRSPGAQRPSRPRGEDRSGHAGHTSHSQENFKARQFVAIPRFVSISKQGHKKLAPM